MLAVLREDFTLVLAIVGAATGVPAVIVQILHYRRDRPRLHLGLISGTRLNEPPHVEIRVTNTGYRPTTVVEVGLAAAISEEFDVVGSDTTVPAEEVCLQINKDPIVVDPGHARSFKAHIIDRLPCTHVDTPLRAYVIEATSRRKIWGPAAPVYRTALDQGWKPPSDTPEEYLKPLDKPIKVSPVVPRWKF